MLRLNLILGLCLGLFLASHAQVSTFPYQQNFDAAHDFTLTGVANIWEAATLSDTGFYTPYSGTGALGTNLIGDYSPGDTSYATSPVFDFSGLSADPYLSFHLKHALEQSGFFGSNGYLRVELSLDGGANWSDLGSPNSGSAEYALNWYDQSGPRSWSDDRLDYTFARHELTGAAGQSAVQFRFVFESDNGSSTDEGVLIDELLVGEKPGTDVEMRSWSIQNSDPFTYGASEGINYTFANQGQDILYTVPFAYEVFGPADTILYEDTLRSSFGINPGGFISGSTGTVNLAAKGPYTIKAYTRLAGDAYRGDDTVTVALTHRTAATPTLPYFQGFEAVNTSELRYTSNQEIVGLPGGYYENHIDDGVLFFDGDSASEGVRAACLTSEAFGGDQYLELTFDLSALDASSDVLNLSFDYLDDDNSSSSNDHVSVRGSSTSSYIEILDWQATGLSGWQNSGAINLANTLDQAGQNFSGTTQIRFRQGALSNFPKETVCFDNVQLRKIDINAGVTEITTHSGIFNRSVTDSVTVTVAVNGEQAISSVDVKLTTTDPSATTSVLTETVTGNLQDTTFAVVFRGLDLTATGTFDLTAVTSTTGDKNPNDDTLRAKVASLPAASLPYSEDFEFATDRTYNTNSIVNGTNSLYYSNSTPFGKLQVNPSGYLGSDGGKAVFLSSTQQNLNELTLTVDASAYTTADSIVLRFFLQEFNDEPDAEDQVYVRGSIDDPWLSILDWNTAGIEGLWREFTLDFSAALTGAGQDFSATTQVKFSQNDNFSLPSDGLGVDQIQVFEGINADLKAVSATINDGFGFSQNENVALKIANVRVDSVDNYLLILEADGPTGPQSNTLRVATTLAPQDTTVIFLPLDLSLVGNYQYSFRVVANGDLDPTNDSLAGRVIHRGAVNSLPFVATFNDLPDSTYTEAVSLYPGVYFHTPDSLGSLRTRGDSLATYFQRPGAAYLGGAGENELVFTLDLNGKDMATDEVFVNYRYQNQDGPMQVGEGVFVRGSRLDAWNLLAVWDDKDGENNASPGPIALHDTLAKYGQAFSATTQIKFVQKGALAYPDGGLMVDHFVVNDVDYDLQAISNSGASDFRFLNEFGTFDAQGIAQRISNEGATFVGEVEAEIVVFDLNNPAQRLGSRIQTLTLNLNPGEEGVFELGNLPLPGPGRYRFNTLIKAPADIDPFNNQSEYFFVNAVDRISDFPFTYGFETDTPFTIPLGDWEIGQPAGPTLDTPFTGHNVLATNLDGAYDDSSSTYLPVFDFSGETVSPMISFALNYHTDVTDGLKLLVNINQGGWQVVGSNTSDSIADFAANWYNSTEGWSGSSNGWVHVQHQISGAEGADHVQFRLAFNGSNGTALEGAMIDDIQVYIPTAANVGLYQVGPNPVIGTSLAITDSLSVDVGVTNIGTASISNVDIQWAYENYEGTVNYPATLAPGDSAIVRVGNFHHEDSVHILTVSLDESVDGQIANDKVEYLIFTRTPIVLPYFMDSVSAPSTTIQTIGTVPGRSNEWFIGDSGNSASRFETSFQWQGSGDSYYALGVDLSDQSVTDPVYLSFTAQFNDLSSCALDNDLNGVYVQGSPQDEWLLVTRYEDIDNIQGTKRFSQPINLSLLLSAAGQSYSDFTAVRFGRSVQACGENERLSISQVILTNPKVDFGIVDQSLPTSSTQLTDNETITVDIQNFGAATDSSVQVVATITDENGQEQIISQSAAGPFAVGDLVRVSLLNINLAAAGGYSVSVQVIANGDEEPDNDTILGTIRKIRLVDTFPFSESFESTAGGFFTDADSSIDRWERGPIKDDVYFNGGGDGQQAWVTNLGSPFQALAEAYLYSPIFDTRSLSSTPILSFLLQYNIGTPNFLAVEVSEDGGANWEILGTRTKDAQADTALVRNWGTNGTWVGSQQEATLTSYPLTDLAGKSDVRFRFRFSSTENRSEFGAAIDAIQVSTSLNQVPTVQTELPDRTVVSDFGTETISLNGVFTDPDGGPLTYSVAVADTTIVEGQISNGSSLMLSQQGNGATTVTITATDEQGGSASTSFLFTINEAPRVINPIADTFLVSGFAWTLDLSQVFQDTDPLAYGALASTDSSVAYLSPLSSESFALVDGLRGGTVNLTVYAADAIGDTTFEQFSVTINAAPRLILPLSDTSLAMGFNPYTIELTNYITDPEGGTLDFAANSTIESVVAVSLDGDDLTFTEGGSVVGTSLIKILATDDVGTTSTFSFLFTVDSPPAVVSSFTEQAYPVGFGSATLALSELFQGDLTGYEFTAVANPDSVVDIAVSDNSLLFEEIAKAYQSQIRVTATKPSGLSTSHVFNLFLTSKPEPIAQSVSRIDTSGTGPWQVDLDTLFTDLQGDALTYSVESQNTDVVAANLPNGGHLLTLSEIGLGTAVLQVTASDARGTSDPLSLRFTVAEASVTGLDEFTALARVYPVPTTNQVTVQMDLVKSTEATVILTDLQGREVYRKDLGTTIQIDHTLPLTGQGSGTWFLIVLLDGQPFSWPIIKQ